MVDAEADEAGKEWHPPLLPDLLAIDHIAFKASQAVCRLAAAILPQFPTMRDLSQFERRRRPAHPAPTSTHQEGADDDDDFASADLLLLDVPASGESLSSSVGACACVRSASSPKPSTNQTSAASRLLQAGRADGGEEVQPRFPHAWCSAGIATWRCTQCGVVAAACPSKPEGGACAGLPKAITTVTGKGHVLWRFDPTPASTFASYVCCKACGASGSPLAWQNLSGSCPGKWTSSTTQQAWSRLQQGKHPHPRHKGRNLFYPGVPLPLRQAPEG